MASLSDSLVRHLLESRYIASLATKNADGSTHMVAVWYWFDGAHIYIATSMRTRHAQGSKSAIHAQNLVNDRLPRPHSIMRHKHRGRCTNLDG
jgi:nitroimidazol reductase NimA-like FMN-containing flavoprotein (pyridoxamine 5'-phosphate oxidase superfamily)